MNIIFSELVVLSCINLFFISFPDILQVQEAVMHKTFSESFRNEPIKLFHFFANQFHGPLRIVYSESLDCEKSSLCVRSALLCCYAEWKICFLRTVLVLNIHFLGWLSLLILKMTRQMIAAISAFNCFITMFECNVDRYFIGLSSKSRKILSIALGMYELWL